jgi:hypothetical protein
MKIFAPIFTLAIVLIVAVFVWPTMYHYSMLNGKPVRINRITGSTEILYPSGWQSVGSANSSQSNSDSSSSGVEKQSGMLSVGTSSVTLGDIKVDDIQVTGDTITCEVVNTSSHPLTFYGLQVEAYDANGNVLPDQPFDSIVYGETLNPNQSVPDTLQGVVVKEPDIGEFKLTVSYGTQ